MSTAVSIGDRIGDYEITNLLNVGGMSWVYRARHATFRKRQVAIKVLRPELAHNQEIIFRLKREARVIGKLRHPNILRVYNFLALTDRDPPLYAIVMELLRGCDMASHIAAVGAMEPAAAVAVGRQVADALSVLHSAELLHRDIKPANIFLAPTTDNKLHVKLLDFGLAKGTSSQHRTKLTGDGQVAGTPEYMAPEQFLEERVDERSDLYGLGATLYEMLAGVPPYGKTADHSSYVEFMIKVTDEDPQPIGASRPARLTEVPPALEAVVWRCLQKNSQARFSHAADLSEALEASLTEDSDYEFDPEEISTGVVTPTPRAPSARLSWMLLALASALLVTTICLLLIVR